MSDEARVSEFKVIDINQEHWTIAAVPCDCGGAWRAGTQAFVDVGGVPSDEFDVTCETCGVSATFRFDISAFFAHGARVEEWVKGLLPDTEERVRGRIARKVGPPLGTKFRSLVQDLANDGDVTTLLYLRWQIDRALAEMQQRAVAEEPR